MRFKEYIIKKGNYDSLYKYGRGVINRAFKDHPLHVEEKEDIISTVIEELLVKNEEVINLDAFKKGHFANYIWYKGLDYLNNNKDKKRLVFADVIKKDVADKEYDVEKEPKEDINIDFLIGKIKNKNLKNIITDKFLNKLSGKELEKKHNFKSMTNIYRKVKRDVEEKTNYKGVCSIKDGKIIKCYPTSRSVAKDGFVPSRVIALCKGKGNVKGLHKSYNWSYIKEFKDGKSSL